MQHRREVSAPMLGGEPLHLRRSPQDGVRWERADGFAVRLAAPERAAEVQRGRVSLLGMLLAWAASGAPQR